MRRILVPYDGSDSAKRAVQYAAEAAKAAGSAQIHVLNVQQNPVYFDGVVSNETMQEVQQALLDQGHKLALEAAAIVQQASVPHQLHVKIGPAAGEVIAKEAEAIGCESIVMGTRGHGAFSSLLLGSVSARVIHLAHVPVTLVK